MHPETCATIGTGWLSILLLLLSLGCRNGSGSCLYREARYPNGALSEQIIGHIDKNGTEVRDGVQMQWYENGKIWRRIEYKNGQRDGGFIEWYPDGTKAKQGQYLHDQEEGNWEAWQPDGTRAWQAQYRSGKIAGQKLYWSAEKLIRRETYENGVMTMLETWFDSGMRESLGHYQKGKQHGAWTYWSPSGAVKAVGQWKDGRPWEGICCVPVAGDAGSIGGLVTCHTYNEGRVVAEATTQNANQNEGIMK